MITLEKLREAQKSKRINRISPQKIWVVLISRKSYMTNEFGPNFIFVAFAIAPCRYRWLTVGNEELTRYCIAA